MPDTEGPDKIVLDAASFNSAERMECQTHFDAPFGDLLRCIFEAVDLRRDGPAVVQIIDRDGVQHFPDQIIQYMLWVQTKRERPDAELDEFDNLVWRDLSGAHIRGLLGKDQSSGKPKKSSRGRASAGSSKD